MIGSGGKRQEFTDERSGHEPGVAGLLVGFVRQREQAAASRGLEVIDVDADDRDEVRHSRLVRRKPVGRPT